MVERIVVRKGAYHDSAFLMRVSREITERAGVQEAVVLMGTPMNRELLQRTGFGSGLEGATPLDMIVALRAEDAAALDAAERELGRLLTGGGERGRQSAGATTRPRSIAEAVALHPEANVVTIAVPGAYAAYVANRALEAGRHVFLFSDNVSRADEIALKRRGLDLGLLVMGPDCGTAILAGAGLGFANRVPRGSIGLVGASGTGLQEVSSGLAHLGLGISGAIGTGSRDLSAEVGGMMTELALRAFGADPETAAVVLVAKHPSAEVAARIHRLLGELGKPVVVRYLGQPGRASEGQVTYADDLDDCVERVAALFRFTTRPGPNAAVQMAERAAALLRGKPWPGGRLVGLFCGGSLAAEALLILGRHGLEAEVPDDALPMHGRIPGERHLIVDTGEDYYTVGRPHPMVDQTVRCALLEAAAADPAIAVILLDIVLGDGAHANPAPEIGAAFARGRRRRSGQPLCCVASVCGTDLDPQQASQQRAQLGEAGIEVTHSATRAAHLAAALVGAANGGAR
jgi:FdrA protein